MAFQGEPAGPLVADGGTDTGLQTGGRGEPLWKPHVQPTQRPDLTSLDDPNPSFFSFLFTLD